MSIKGIKDAFSQRVLRLYGQNQAVLDWRKPVLSLALGCVLLPFLWLIQPVVFTEDMLREDQPEIITKDMGSELDEEKMYSASSVLAPVSSMTPAVLYPTSEGEVELADDNFYDQLQLENIVYPFEEDLRLNPISALPPLAPFDGAQYQATGEKGPYLEPTILPSKEPAFIVDGQEIPATAPYRNLNGEDIAKFIWRKVPYAPEMMKRLLPQERNGVVEIQTQTGNWPGGRPYWPAQIRDREIKNGDHLKSWFPVGKARTRKDMGARENMAFVPGWDLILRKVNVSGKETYSILNGRVLQKGETVEVNRHVIFGSREIPAIGLYNDRGKLIYGEPTPPEISDRTLMLPFKDGYYAVIGKYPCDNGIYLSAYTTLDQQFLDYYLNTRLRQGFEDVTAKKALRYCEDQLEATYAIDQSAATIPTFIVNGKAIPEDAPITIEEPAEVIKREFLTPDLKQAPMVIDKGIIRITTKSGKWKGGRPYWPQEIKGKAINNLGQTIFTSLNGHFLKDEETKVINAYETTFIIGLHVLGIYDEQGRLVLGKPTSPEIEQAAYRVRFQNGYTVVAPKYPCDANLSIGLVFTIDGLKAQGDIWQQTQAVERISIQMIEEHCRQIDENRERRTVYKPVTPEPLFIIDGQVIDPAEPYREISNDEWTTERFLQPAVAVGWISFL